MNIEERNDKNIGMISVSRTTGGYSSRFVGSTVPSDTAIRIRISQAEKYSDKFNKEKFRSKNNLVEVEMTPNQWAELITTLNYGTGTPCTVVMVGNERIPQTYVTDSVLSYYNDKLQKEFSRITSDFQESFREALDILDNKKSITKADREAIKRSYSQVERFVGDSAPFIQKLFKEDLEKHVIDAATTFKNDMDSVIKSLAKTQLENIESIENLNYEKLGMMLLERSEREKLDEE